LKAWIEYVNRLIGAIIGLLVVLTVIRSLPLWSLDKSITSLSILNLFLVLFQAWIGSIVVSTNLLPWMITLHMILALVIVCVLLYVHFQSHRLIHTSKVTTEKPGSLFSLLIIGFVLMLAQVVFGTQVREEIDVVAFEFGNLLRGEWIEHLGLVFLIHRSYSILLLAVHILFFYKVYKYTLRHVSIFKWSQALVFVIFLEILTGVGMAYFGVPAFLQPIHLLLGTLIIGIQFVILLQLDSQKKFNLENTGS
jgi:cytochrome c oxidase assembly protein subunit 15